MRAIVAVLLVGCSSTAGFIGDKSQPVQLQPVVAAGGKLQTIQSGAHVDLVAQSGSWMVLAGARARNLTDSVAVAAQLVDWTSSQTLESAQHSLTLARASDGWGEPAAADLVPLDACRAGVVGQPVLLSLTVDDASSPPRTADALLTVVPECPAGADCSRCADLDGGVD